MIAIKCQIISFCVINKREIFPCNFNGLHTNFRQYTVKSTVSNAKFVMAPSVFYTNKFLIFFNIKYVPPYFEPSYHYMTYYFLPCKNYEFICNFYP